MLECSRSGLRAFDVSMVLSGDGFKRRLPDRSVPHTGEHPRVGLADVLGRNVSGLADRAPGGQLQLTCPNCGQ